MPIAVHHGKYAFEEEIDHGDGTGGWRLWYIPAAGASAVVLDSTDNDPQALASTSPAVWLALTDDRLVWNAIHETPTGPHFYLRSYEFKNRITRNLAEADASSTEFWFPDADDAGRLVYSTVERSASGSITTTSYHVYYTQIGDGPLQPQRLDKDGDSTEPVLSGDDVVWKAVNEGVTSWGGLSRYPLSKGVRDDVFFDHQTSADYQTAGDRYVAAWLPDDTIFEVYDLQTDTSLLIEKHEPTSPHGVVRPKIAGDLLTFIRVDNDPGADLQLCWTRLPPPG
jgi:hypothetical protein